jgi:hypothetical protein
MHISSLYTTVRKMGKITQPLFENVTVMNSESVQWVIHMTEVTRLIKNFPTKFETKEWANHMGSRVLESHHFLWAHSTTA